MEGASLDEALVKFVHRALKQSPGGKHLEKLKLELDCTEDVKTERIANWYRILARIPHLFTMRPATAEVISVVLTTFRWDLPAAVVSAYLKFLAGICRSDNGWTKDVVRAMVWSMCPRLEKPALVAAAKKYYNMHNPELEEFEEREESEAEQALKERRFEGIHTLLRALRDDIPMMPSLLVPNVVKLFPHKFRASHVILDYVRHLRQLVEDFPDERERIIAALMDKLLKLDCHLQMLEGRRASRSLLDLNEVFGNSSGRVGGRRSAVAAGVGEGQEERVKELDRRRQNAEEMVDGIMLLLLEYCTSVYELDPKLVHTVFSEFLRAFSQIMCTKAKCVQFILFYCCKFDSIMCEDFLGRLMKVVFDQNASKHKRRCAVNFVAGLLTKANYVRQSTVVLSFEHLAVWVIQYTNLYERQFGTKSIETSAAAYHELFYTVCGAVFMILAYQSESFERDFETFDDAARHYGLDKAIASALQPLRYCHGDIAGEFVRFCWKFDILSDVAEIRDYEPRPGRELVGPPSPEPTTTPRADDLDDNKQAMNVDEEADNSIDPDWDEERRRWLKADGLRVVTFPFDGFTLPECSKLIYPLFREYKSRLKATPPRPSPLPVSPGVPKHLSPCQAMDTATPILTSCRSPMAPDYSGGLLLPMPPPFQLSSA